MTTLRALKEDDVLRIRQWPPYPGDMEQMDYALREKGWLDELRHDPAVTCFATLDGEEMVGFTILRKTEEGVAEFSHSRARRQGGAETG